MHQYHEYERLVPKSNWYHLLWRLPI